MERGHDDWAAPLPSATSDRLRALALPVLLVAVAALGVYRSATLDQSSWHGASFGMFATYDGPFRTVAVTVTGPDGPYRVVLPEDLRDDAQRLRVVPTGGAADALAGTVLERVADDAGTAVEVAVWRVALREDDGAGLHLRIETLVTGTAS